MSAIAGAIAAEIIAVAAKVGAPIVKGIVERRAGGMAGDVAGKVIDAIAGQAGVEPEALPDIAKSDPGRLETAVAETEAAMPELIGLWSKGLDHQFALLETETREGFWQSFWRWGWMYLLAFFWLWRIIVLPVWNARASVPIEGIDFAILMTLTAWFLSLYMGGHTIKELGKNVSDVFRNRKTGT